MLALFELALVEVFELVLVEAFFLFAFVYFLCCLILPLRLLLAFEVSLFLLVEGIYVLFDQQLNFLIHFYFLDILILF